MLKKAMYVLSDHIMVSNHWFIAEKLKLFNLFWHKKQLNSDFLVSSESMYKMPNKERKCPCFCFTVGKLSDVSLLLAKITFYFNYSLHLHFLVWIASEWLGFETDFLWLISSIWCQLFYMHLTTVSKKVWIQIKFSGLLNSTAFWWVVITTMNRP